MKNVLFSSKTSVGQRPTEVSPKPMEVSMLLVVFVDYKVLIVKMLKDI
jgi:hypothetical protein